MYKIIHADNVHSINFKGWFALMVLQACFYRCYVEHLEQTLLQTALPPEKEMNDEQIEGCKEQLDQCRVDHMDKGGDPVALFCLAIVACRSVHLGGQPIFANQLFQKLKTDFPKEGLPGLFNDQTPLNLHLELLQIFGVLTHDGKKVCYTQNEFKDAIQFVLQGREKAFTILLPLDISKKLFSMNTDIIERYFDHFFPARDSHFSIDPLPIPQVSEVESRLSYYLVIRQALQTGDYACVDKIISSFPKFCSEHVIALTERFLQEYLKMPTFSLSPLYGKEKGVELTAAFANILFSQNNPTLSRIALSLWLEHKEEPKFKVLSGELLPPSIPFPTRSSCSKSWRTGSGFCRSCPLCPQMPKAQPS